MEKKSSMVTLKVPREAMQFRAASLAVTDADKEKARFRMVANSGKPFAHPWFGMFAIDLDGIDLGRQDKPALLDHDPSQRIGYTEKIEVGDEGLVATGRFLKSTDAGRQVLAELSEGYPFQASVFVVAREIQRLSANETTEVNGHELTGPGHVFRKSELREVTFTAMGADEQTSAAKLGANQPHEILLTVTLSQTGDQRGVRGDEPQDTKGAAVTKENAAKVAEPTADAIRASLKDFPEVVAELHAVGAAKERERIAKLRRATRDYQQDMLTQLISDGKSVEDSLLALTEDAIVHERSTKADAKQASMAALQTNSTTHDVAKSALPSDAKVKSTAAKLAWDRLSKDQQAEEWNYETFEFHFMNGKR